jgi:hypothetical protein
MQILDVLSRLKRLEKWAKTKQILYSGEALVGPAGCYVFGIDYTVGDLYYKDINGNWSVASYGSGGGDGGGGGNPTCNTNIDGTTTHDDCPADDQYISLLIDDGATPLPWRGTWDEFKTCVGGSSGTGDYIPQGPTTVTVGGISQGNDLGTDPVSVQDILDMMLYPYVAPSMSLSMDAGDLYEVGDTIPFVTLYASTTKHSNDITLINYYRDSVLINTNSSPDPNGTTESYTDNTDVTTDVMFQADVSDGGSTITSNTLYIQFVYAYYYGVGSPGLSAASVGLLDKQVMLQTNSYTTSTSPSSEVYYYAYPAAYGTLSSILDTNGFETIGDYTLRVEDITNTFGQTTSYNIYEFNNLTTQTNFENTYIQPN